MITMKTKNNHKAQVNALIKDLLDLHLKRRNLSFDAAFDLFEKQKALQTLYYELSPKSSKKQEYVEMEMTETDKQKLYLQCASVICYDARPCISFCGTSIRFYANKLQQLLIEELFAGIWSSYLQERHALMVATILKHDLECKQPNPKLKERKVSQKTLNKALEYAKIA